MKNEYVRHILATIKYRLKKSLMYSSEQFDTSSLGNGSRSPLEILVHMFEVLDWAIKKTEPAHHTLRIPSFFTCKQGLAHFLRRIDLYDDILFKEELDPAFAKKLLQGPLADILTHIGQIAMLSRLNQAPIKGENFFEAPIVTSAKENDIV